MRERVGAQGLGRAVKRAGDGRALACHERTGARVEPQHFRGADLRGGPPAQLLELAAQSFGLGGVRLGPTGRAAHENLEVVHGPDGDLPGGGVPRPAGLAHGPRERLEPGRRTRDRLMARHQRAAAQRPGQPHELVGGGGGPFRRLELGVEALQVLARLQDEEIRHAEGGARIRGGHGTLS